MNKLIEQFHVNMHDLFFKLNHKLSSILISLIQLGLNFMRTWSSHYKAFNILIIIKLNNFYYKNVNIKYL